MKNLLLAVGAIFTLFLLVGCEPQEKEMSKEEAKSKIFAPTDVNSLSPEARAKIPPNALGPAPAGSNSPQPGAGMTPPPAAGN